MAKVIFFSSSAYALPVLESLLQDSQFELLAVVTKPDKPFGRDQKILPNPITDFCRSHHLTLLQPESFDEDCNSKIKKLKPDLGLCVAYGPPFFTAEMIAIPRYHILNIHPSPLPRYRGATPGPWQIINGETQSAVTFFQIDPLPDHGPIIAQIPFGISPDETADSLYKKAFALAAANLAPIINSYLSDPHSLKPQDHSQKTYFPKFTKESAKINWSWPPAKIERFIRAPNPWPIAWTYVQNPSGQKFKMKIFSTFGLLDFQTLRLNLVQVEGKKPTSWAEISKYYRVISD